MAERIAQLYVELSARTDKLEAALKQSQRGLNKFKGGISDVVEGLTGMNPAAIGTAAAVGALAGGIKYAVAQAAEAEKVMAQTEAVIKSTGGAAGLTAAEVAGMAGSLSQLNAIDDETVQSAQNVLLTFKSIKSDAFEPATQAAIDMSVALGQDLQSSVIQVGKALEDPVRGITALRRAGVSFTQDQQDLIKTLVETGRAAEAQQLILKELNSQFGGSGAAAAGTYAGQLALLRINADNLAQTFGEKLVPLLTDAAEAANILLTWHDKLTTAYDEQHQRLIQSEDDYQEYALALIDAGKWAGKVSDTEAELARQFLETGASLVTNEETLTFVGRKLGLLTEAEFRAARAVEEFGVAAHAAGWELMKQADAASQAERSADAYADRLTGLAEAMGMVRGAGRNMELPDLSRQAEALAAGLSGTIGQAWEDYQDVIADTTPRMQELRAEITRMNAAQGTTWTVFTEAKHSLEEYERAQIRAAKAAQKLAEFTGDNREEYLDLKIAADNAAATVAKMGTEMGLTEMFTADYTKKLMEANGELSLLEAQQLAAKEAIKQATRELIYQKVAADLDADSALNLAREFGLLSEADYIAAQAAGTAAQARRDGKLTMDELYGSTVLLRDVMNSLVDKNITVTISTFYKEYYEQTGQRPEHEGDTGAGGEGGYNGGPPIDPGGGNDRDNRSTGGMTWGGQAYLVGEHGPEIMVAPETGYMLNASRTAEVMGGGGGGDTFYIDARGATMTPAQYEAITRRALAESGRQADNYRRTGRR